MIVSTTLHLIVGGETTDQTDDEQEDHAKEDLPRCPTGCVDDFDPLLVIPSGRSRWHDTLPVFVKSLSAGFQPIGVHRYDIMIIAQFTGRSRETEMIGRWEMNIVDGETLNPDVLPFEIARDGQAIVLVANSNDRGPCRVDEMATNNPP